MRIAILFVTVVGVFGASVVAAILLTSRGSSPVELSAAEVRQYQGEDLS